MEKPSMEGFFYFNTLSVLQLLKANAPLINRVIAIIKAKMEKIS
jgi:hypothetical protein